MYVVNMEWLIYVFLDYMIELIIVFPFVDII